VGLKDIIDHQGRVTTCGSAFYRHRATVSAPCVLAIEDAGGVIIGRTGLHEWAFGFSSENPHWGAVRNPWNPATSPGGSSGGSAAAVAAGITPVAIGTDTGGSVRVPAALCGTFGLKVTYGRIPLDGVFPLVPSIDTIGPLADSVEHLAAAYRVMSGDSTAEPEERPLRIGVPQPWVDDAPASEEVTLAFEHAVSALRALGHQVAALETPGLGPSHNIVWAIAEEVREVHRPFRERGEPYGPDVAARLGDADKVTDAQARSGHDWQGSVRSGMAEAFDHVDLLITPSVPVRSKTIGEDMIGEHHYRAVLSYFSAVVNHTLHPAIAIPLTDTGSPPLSLQAVAPLGGEAALLGFARTLEAAGLSTFAVAGSNSQKQGGDTIG
jgi:aspartyl-tRNA(Asn)/glutamyl-tRNA(Gln) amidotransferase subunit A